ncbi:MFS transporter [Neobacillus sp. SAB-20_R2A]|uniref:MFS transporter n=1 Tax=Neobacillus sp. SAB-20_R2A TaxID=3120519 RepID=UPI003C6E476A
MKNNRNFLFLMLGQSLANIGDVLYIVAVISIIYDATQSAAASTFVPFTITSAMFISGTITPIFIGRFPLKPLLTWSQAAKTVLMFGLGTMLMMEQNLYLIFIVIAVIALFDGCANPVRQALVPYYVAEERLLKANGFSETITQSIQIGTWFFGSLLLMVFTPIQLIWLVAALFVISSILLCLLEKVEHQSKKQGNTWSQLTIGWQTIKVTPVLKILVKMESLETIAGSVWIAAILLVYVKQVLHAGEQWWGFINSAYFIGLVVGSLICVRFSAFVDGNRNRFIVFGVFSTCIVTMLFGVTSLPLIALVLSGLIGLFGQLKNIPQQTVIQTSVPKGQLATVYAAIGTISTGVFGVSSLIMGLVSDYFGVQSVFLISAALLLGVGMLAYNNRQLFMKKEKNF